MKKRQMKKWIPKNTIYCGKCPWYKYIKIENLHKDLNNCNQAEDCNEECWTTTSNSCQVKVIKCEYLNYLDDYENSLLWDGCKECGEHYPRC